MGTRHDREQQRRELLTAIDFINSEPAPATDKDRARMLAAYEGVGVLLVDFLLAEARDKVGDVRKRRRYLEDVSELLDTPPDGSPERDKSRLASFRLVLGAAAMHLTTQAQLEAMRSEHVS